MTEIKLQDHEIFLHTKIAIFYELEKHTKIAIFYELKKQKSSKAHFKNQVFYIPIVKQRTVGFVY